MVKHGESGVQHVYLTVPPGAYNLDLALPRWQVFLNYGDGRITRKFHSLVAARFQTKHPGHYCHLNSRIPEFSVHPIQRPFSTRPHGQ